MVAPDAALAPFALPLRREADAVIADANGQTVLIIDPSRNLDEDAAERIADLVFARLTAAPVREEGGAFKLGESDLFEVADIVRTARSVKHVGSKDYAVADEIVCFVNNHPRNSAAALATREEAPAEAGEVWRLWNEWSDDPERCGTADQHAAFTAALKSALRARPQARKEAQPVLTVCYGSMPESNGRQNWTAILRRVNPTDKWDQGFCFARSEYPERVRYEADRVRWIIGELAEKPDILAYDADAHSGYVAPNPPAPEAEKLRVAVEALEKAETIFASISRRVPYGHSTMSDATHAAVMVRQALAALQQEGR